MEGIVAPHRRKKGGRRSMSTSITASMLYDLVQCPQRVAMDLFEDPAHRDPENPFVQLLWEKGHAFERETIEGLRIPFTDLHAHSGVERQRLTLEALRRGDPLIYGGGGPGGRLTSGPHTSAQE